MKTFIKISIVSIVFLVVFGVFALIIPSNSDVDIADISFAPAVAQAFGSSEDGGCCGGSDPTPPKPKPKPPTPKPAICQSLTADTTSLPYGGGDVTLTWASARANAATLTPDGSSVAVNGSKTVAVVADTTFVLRVSNADGADTCRLPITVAQPPVSLPSCDSFTATPSVFGPNGGTATLAWGTTDATTVSIDNGVGAVAGDGSTDVSITGDITYTLTAENTAGSVTCAAPIIVEPPAPTNISCASNVTFNASTQSLPRGGGNVDFTWTTTGLDAVSFTGLTSTSLSGNESKSIGSDETVTLIGTKDTQSISCPLPIVVATGGGGGSSNPRCKLTASDEKISAGQEVTLTWDTSRARDVILKDSNGKILLETDDKDKFDGSMTVNPKKDTTYTLVSKRGVKERICEVDVEVANTVTVLESRTLEPRVAGISLTQVPYTGFDATPAMTIIFYALLTIWGLFVAYVLVIRRDSIGGVSLAGSHDHVAFTDVSTDADPVTKEPIAEEYVDAVVASTATAQSAAPSNLPTASPIIGYAAAMDEQEVDESIAMTELENRAHAQKVLLSSDAMRLFMSETQDSQRNEKLDSIIADAKETFPSEEGWVAINLSRMEALLQTESDSSKTIEGDVADTPAPITGGSLAEAIVSGNIVAAYQMIESRPMIALADAAADLDAVYRTRKGEKVSVSDMLIEDTKNLTNQQLEEAISALTSAVDGTYTDEAQAVKMAILKAVKAVA